jgi:hypothetical protein
VRRFGLIAVAGSFYKRCGLARAGTAVTISSDRFRNVGPQ